MLNKRNGGVAVLLTVAAVFGSFAFKGSDKIGWSVQRALDQREEAMDLIVFLNERADVSRMALSPKKAERGRQIYEELTQVAQRSQQKLVTWLQEQHLQFHQHYLTNAVEVKAVPVPLIKALAQREDVRLLITDPAVLGHGQQLPHGTAAEIPRSQREVLGVEKNISSTGAERVWKELRAKGKGIILAGQDTGVDWEHPALKEHYRGFSKSRVEHSYNWFDAIKEGSSNPCGFDLKVPCDDDEHGTHTMGTMLGNDGSGNAIGMAPDAQWIACRNMDAGTGKPSTYLSCFEFFLAPYKSGTNALRDGKPELAPHVINNSWGCPPSEGCQGDEFVEVLENLKKAGIMVVVSAGNDGPGCQTIKDPPAYHSDLTLSVGAHDHRNNRIAYFSSRGPSRFDKGIGPDLTAPGVSIRSSIPGGKYASAQWSGTSMAGPHVAGAVALMWSANEKLIGKIDETIKIITETAIPQEAKDNCGGVAGTERPNNTYGYGLLDVYGAVQKGLEVVDDEDFAR